jgi:DNA-binding XRE family transcriptional regulator
MTQDDFAKALSTSQSAVARMEKGEQNFSTEILTKISDVLEHRIVSINNSIDFQVNGGKKLSGSITTNFSNGVYNFVTKASISIPTNNSSASNVVSPFNPTAATLVTSDFIVIPTNIYAAKYPVYVSGYDQTNGNVTITGVFNKTQIAFNTDNTNNLNTTDSVSGLNFTNLIGCLKIEENTAAATEIATYAVIGIKNV